MAETPTKNLRDLKVADLKVELEKRGLQTSGVKAVLIERLQTALDEEGVNTGESNQDQAEEVEARNEEVNTEEAAEAEARNEGVVEETSNKENLVGGESEDQVVQANAENEEALNGDDGKVMDEVHENGNGERNDGNEDNEDSLNIMIGDEDNLFGDDNDNKDAGMNGVIHASPPRPDSIPAKHPFTSKDTISLNSRTGKAPSDNSSMLVNPDECSVASHDSGENKDMSETAGEKSEADSKEQNGSCEKPKEEKEDDKKKNISQNSRNLWISGLSSTTRATDLKSVFSKHGKVNGAKVVTNARTPGARCYGYVTMGSSEDAAKCIQSLNKTELHGRMITVERAKDQTGTSKTAEDKKKEGDKKEEKKDEKRDSGSSSNNDDKKSERNRITAPEGSSSGAKKDDVRRQSSSSRPGSSSHQPSRHSTSHHSTSHPTGSRHQERRSHGSTSQQVLTFNQIKDQRRREQEREEERRRRDQERRRREEEDRRRRQRDEEDRLRRERDDLRRERERLEREKQGMGSINQTARSFIFSQLYSVPRDCIKYSVSRLYLESLDCIIG